jgi:hypothetical protein
LLRGKVLGNILRSRILLPLEMLRLPLLRLKALSLELLRLKTLGLVLLRLKVLALVLLRAGRLLRAARKCQRNCEHS